MAENRRESIEKLEELIEGIDFCMLTTLAGGKLRSRPMSTQEFEFDGDLWFFTSDGTHKIDEVRTDNRVSVAYSQPDEDRYVSVFGRGEIVRDQQKIEELWNPVLKAWFPEGLDDPHLCLLKVAVEEAEYWDAPNSKLVQLAGFVKARVTGQEAQGGEYGKVRL
ncbi:MAG: pyridoxamine 5'-phosphate oxidase family protein [Acidobacteria bacterium]|nr:pyridoxamine 5'-phosphate oxidase family protein [Acidobacteriota bacterium]MCA1607861.1 pyridoxamine 5'-phosphate oxidase family protein [Acidobacteriota bacterium]